MPATESKNDLSGSVRIEKVKSLEADSCTTCGVVFDHPKNTKTNLLKFIWSENEYRRIFLGVLLALPGILAGELAGIRSLWLEISSLVALVIVGYPVARSAWKSILRRDINVNVLMTIAAIGAVAIGAYNEAGTVMVLFAIGEILEEYTNSRSRNAICAMMDVVPRHANLLHPNGGQKLVDVDSLKPGDIILAKPGERIPMDGLVLSGTSQVNQAPITGESSFVEKTRGNEVFASSINGQGALQIKVVNPATDNTISRLVRMVEEAEEKRAPAQRFIDQFARYYTPAIVLLALLVIVIPPLFFGQPFLPSGANQGWLYRGLTLLVIGCPCALVISTPVSIISAISNAARHGVLIKGGSYLEALSHIKALAFDKTGTLTAGKPSVVAVRSVNDDPIAHAQPETCQNCSDLIALAYAVEQSSEHPLANAIHIESSLRGVENRYPAAEMVTALSGMGVSGSVDGRRIMLGSHGFFDKNIPHPLEDCEAASLDAANGHTPLLVSDSGKYMGTITVADTLRESSVETIKQQKALGINNLIMLTGDHEDAARRVAEKTGVTDVRAGLLPEKKVEAVHKLMQEYGTVAMVGDGINDAPALASSSVGIAIGAAMGGSRHAMETADIALMQPDLHSLPFAIRLSKTAMRTIYINFTFALAVKLAFFILALMGLTTMWMAIFADTGALLLVTLNGMRLLRNPGS
jgi:Zn2+/Cd2+-exporting ATPase